MALLVQTISSLAAPLVGLLQQRLRFAYARLGDEQIAAVGVHLLRRNGVQRQELQVAPVDRLLLGDGCPAAFQKGLDFAYRVTSPPKRFASTKVELRMSQ